MENNSIGQRIKQVRKGEKLTQTEFASVFGLSHSHISNIENGRENPSDTLLLFISYKFNIDFDWIKTGNGDYHPLQGASKTGTFNRYNLARHEYENSLKDFSSDELWNSVDAFFNFTQLLDCSEINVFENKREPYLKHIKIMSDKLFIIHSSTLQMYKDKKLYSNENEILKYQLKVNRLLNEAEKEFRKGIEILFEPKEIDFTITSE